MLVYYSLALPPDEPRPDLVWQFSTSVASLRAVNRRVPVVLFLFGGEDPELLATARAHAVQVVPAGSYEARLAQLCPQGWRALARYPLLHKFLHFQTLAEWTAGPVLFCDCDTFFFDDPERLEARYRGPDLVAREEVHTRRSAHGVDSSFVDEGLLGTLAASEGGRPIPPFNLGAVLFGRGVARRLAGSEPWIVDYAWRFVSWMALNPAEEGSSFGEFKGIAEARAALDARAAARALPFPSSNRWILDEVSLWMALGHVPGLTTADFTPEDVPQNGELLDADPEARAGAGGWLLCHYYSQNTERFATWLEGRLSSVPS